MRFMVINSTLPSPPPQIKRKERKKEYEHSLFHASSISYLYFLMFLVIGIKRISHDHSYAAKHSPGFNLLCIFLCNIHTIQIRNNLNQNNQKEKKKGERDYKKW